MPHKQLAAQRGPHHQSTLSLVGIRVLVHQIHLFAALFDSVCLAMIDKNEAYLGRGQWTHIVLAPE